MASQKREWQSLRHKNNSNQAALTLSKLLMQPNDPPLQSLALAPAIDSHFLTVAPDTPLVDVLALMSHFRSCMLPGGDLSRSAEANKSDKISCVDEESEILVDVADTAAGCVLVIEEPQLLGVFTERDIVRLTAAGITLGRVKVSDVVTLPAITLRQDQNNDVFTALGLFRQHRIRHLPIVDEQNRPVGIVTHDSIRRALQPVNLLTRLRYVNDVMTNQVIHAPETVSVLELAKLMTEHQVSCVVICKASGIRNFPPNPEKEDSQEAESYPPLSKDTQGNEPAKPVGIVTERDIVQFQALELDLSRMLAQDVMSTPLFCLQPTDSLWLAHEEMHRRQVRRIVVTNQQEELVGIVSQTSLLQVLNPADMYGVIEILQQAVEERTSQLKNTNQQLRHEILVRQKAELELLKAHDQLKVQVEERTAQLTQANEQLKQDIVEREQIEAALRQSEAQLRQKATTLKLALKELHSYQTQLIQTEKMSSLGQLVAGVAHEINNPINFVYGNIAYASQYIHDIMHLLELYDQYYPHPVQEILDEAEKIDLNFVKIDLPKLLTSMKMGADRIRDLVLSLRNFSRLDEAEMKSVDLHDGIDSTLLILQNQLKASAGRSEITVIKEYGNLPSVECYAGQLNQVFMNLLSNAIDALEESRMLNSQVLMGNALHLVSSPWIRIHTGIKTVQHSDNTSQSLWLPSPTVPPNVPIAVIRIADNGCGMTDAVRRRLFDPFFTTKTVGKGTGLGLSISYQIVVKKHRGRIDCISMPGQGTEFMIEIPILQRNQANSTGYALD
jgi:signal transduction histidine kinase/CBS domain-containing protein